ncbi:MAG TPA: FAD-dependent oxidoreductase [Spirochaetota bacterium]|nr:FAD-dependent oxidoreductase [Spirochaetota bacterium]
MKIIIENIELFPGEPELRIGSLLRERLGLDIDPEWSIDRKSLDARDKGRIVYRYRVIADVPERFASTVPAMTDARLWVPAEGYPAPRARFGLSVIVVGAGPAGLFCALRLIEAGARVLVLERGRPVEERMRDIHALRAGGMLDPESNVLFGEGGAGAYSDGKLTTRIHRPEVEWFFQTMVDCGAPTAILYDARPHIGTDGLIPLLGNIRRRIEDAGSTIRFGERVTGLIREGGRAAGVTTATGGEYRASAVVLATGHSARDVYDMLTGEKVALEKKGFAVGVRIEHPARLIDRIQYGKAAEKRPLPAADYRLTFNNRQSGRGVYSFCMCPGGEVVNASSEEGLLCTNGMSYSGRDGEYSNAALVVTVSPDDLGPSPLAGIGFQREIERKAFEAGGGGWEAPVERIRSFLGGGPDTSVPATSYRPGVRAARVREYLPGWIADELAIALKSFDRKMKGFIGDEGVIIGAETRSSSPVRVVREADLQSVSLPSLYPVGEGAGHAGGIVSSAVDGMRAADAICTAAGL